MGRAILIWHASENMNRFEYAARIALRVKMLEKNAKPFIEIDSVDLWTIAEEEFRQGFLNEPLLFSTP